MATTDELRETLTELISGGHSFYLRPDLVRVALAALDELATRRAERDAPDEAGAVVGGHAFGDDGPAPPAWLVEHVEAQRLRADNAALAAALRQTVTPWLVFGVQGTCCRWCGALDPLSTGGQSHAADCPVAVLARHDAARGEG